MDTNQAIRKPETARKRCLDVQEMLSHSKKNRTLYQASKEATFQAHSKHQPTEIWGLVGSMKHVVSLEAKMVQIMDNIGRGL